MRRRVSVIITAHDAEARIELPLRGLGAQSLPPDVDMDVIVVDDRSTDGTASRARRVAADVGIALRVERRDGPPPSGVTARVAALEAGIAASSAPWLLLLDDDALIESTYVARLLGQLQFADIVAPPIHYRTPSTSLTARAIAALQSVDAALYHAVAGAVARTGRPSGVCFGGVGLRRAVLDRVGGLTACGFTFVEDLAFARLAHARGASFAFPRAPRLSVAAPPTIASLTERAARVGAAGGLSVLAAALALPVASLVVALVFGFVGVVPWTVVVARWIGGSCILGWLQVRRGARPSVTALLTFELAATLLAILVAIHIWRRPAVRWGGLVYARGSRTLSVEPRGSA